MSVTGIGGGTGAGNNDAGIELEPSNAVQATGGGSITLQGTGGDAGGSGGSATGIEDDSDNSIVSVGGGSITLIGTGGGGGGAGSENHGVSFDGSLAGSGGAISITGTGGNGTGTTNIGIVVSGQISNTGSGSITLNGTSGTGTGAAGASFGQSGYIPGEYGVVVAAPIVASTGNIAITGHGERRHDRDRQCGHIAALRHLLCRAPSPIAPRVPSRPAAAAPSPFPVPDRNGTAGGNDGVMLADYTGSGPTISAVDGLISITGTNNATDTSDSEIGVYFENGTVDSTGAGGVSITGYGGGTGAGGSDYGVNLSVANAIQSTGSGAITITGTGGDNGGSGGSNYGVNIAGALAGNGGAISITGTGGNSSGNSNFGINQSAAITNTGAGSITLNGTGGGTGTLARTAIQALDGQRLQPGPAISRSPAGPARPRAARAAVPASTFHGAHLHSRRRHDHPGRHQRPAAGGIPDGVDPECQPGHRLHHGG